MEEVRTTDDFTPGMGMPMPVEEVRDHWLAALEWQRYAPMREHRTMAIDHMRCPFGVLCEVCHDLGLLHVTAEEMSREYPPYSVLMLAGVGFEQVIRGEASGGDVATIERFCDDDEHDHPTVARFIRELFRKQPDPFIVEFEFTDTQGLGGDGHASFRLEKQPAKGEDASS